MSDQVGQAVQVVHRRVVSRHRGYNRSKGGTRESKTIVARRTPVGRLPAEDQAHVASSGGLFPGPGGFPDGRIEFSFAPRRVALPWRWHSRRGAVMVPRAFDALG